MRALALVMTILAMVLGPLAGEGRADAVPAGGEMVLCTELGAVSVTLDAEGMPIKAPLRARIRHCDDCLQPPLPGLMTSAPAMPTHAMIHAGRVWRGARQAEPRARTLSVHTARAPPRVI